MGEFIYTIGHSNQSIDEFYEMLKEFHINCVVDVRSVPFSKYTPQFNSYSIKEYLKTKEILYAPFGEYFGARREDCLCEESDGFLKKNQVDFQKGVQTNAFLTGEKRLRTAMGQGRIVALMCSESDALMCHRFSFVSRFFYDKGVEVRHILKSSGSIFFTDHAELEKRMIKEYVDRKKIKPVEQVLFSEYEYSEEQQRNDAYRLKNGEIGWIKELREKQFID